MSASAASSFAVSARGLPGSRRPDSRGEYRGLDADYCRAVAAAVLGDATKVRFVALTAQNRFTALQAGEIDVLFRNLDPDLPARRDHRPAPAAGEFL